MFQRIALVAAAAIVTASPSIAADLPGPAPLPEFGPESPMEFGSDWYLRLDIGYVDYDDPDISRGDAVTFSDQEFDSGFSYGFGFGTEFYDFLRADATFEYRPGITASATTLCPAATCGTATTVRHNTDIDSWLVLGNLYVDLGNWEGLTPYIGAGAGVAYHEVDRVHRSPGVGGVTSIDGTGQWDFAWALMAGASYDLTPNWKIDASYRYTNLGEAVSSDTTVLGTQDPSQIYSINDITSQDIRIGVRYVID